MDAQIAPSFQAEEQAKEQYKSFQISKRVEIDPMIQYTQVQHRQNRQNSSGQVRPN